MAPRNPFARHLYLRIWLAVVGGMAVLTLLVGWAWRLAAEHNEATRAAPSPREVVLRDAAGRTVLQGSATRVPGPPGEGVLWRIESAQGEAYVLDIAPRADRPGRALRAGPGGPGTRGGPPGARSEAAFWLRPPFGFLWMLALVGISVAIGVFPILRRLTQRLGSLQRSVQRFGEGDLSVRVPEYGHDEMADLARQFNAAAARIETLVASHKSLLANASHELRSPLARIRMGMELQGANGAPSPASRAEILRNIAELDQLVDEILLASRLDAREADVGTFESVDLLGLAAEECARTGAVLSEQAEPLDVRGVPKLLRRALRNLLENARRYSQGEVAMDLQREAGMARMAVTDGGPGVPPALRERIFEPFYRLPGASEHAGGVGLGLALVRAIAQRHGGSVHCEAAPGGGARFVLRLPLAG